MEEFYSGNCSDCPLVKQNLQEISGIEAGNQDAAEHVMSSGFDFAMEKAYESITSFGNTAVVGLSGNLLESDAEFTAEIRKGIAQKMDETEEEAEKLMRFTKSMIENCEGPLKMRARKAGRIITVTVCSSLDAPFGDNCEATHVNRKLQ